MPSVSHASIRTLIDLVPPATLPNRARARYTLQVKIRFYIRADTDEPHIYDHQVTEEEVAQVLARPLEERPGREGALLCLGRTRDGRFLRVVYVPDPEPDSVFVVTAYEPGPKVLKALRRRLRKK